VPTILVTGAGRGIGRELVNQFAAEGWKVIATLRDPKQAERDVSQWTGVRIEQLDQSDNDSCLALAQRLKGVAIDVLFLNAGVNLQHGASLADTDYGNWPKMFQTNVIGPVLLASSLIENVETSSRKIIVAMGSLAGSFATPAPGNYLYRTSKAALHSAMRGLANDLRSCGVAVAVLHPGRVRVERMPDNPVPVERSVEGLRQVLAGLDIGQSGKFIDYLGNELSW
jgi:NAD(P)-dependent dehydrogenase (short-subunit alcohol dehydrogenase family)